jgi:hypothetical protein
MRRQYAGGAKPTTLSGSLGGSTGDLSISGTDFSNYPDGSVGPFYIVIDRGQVTEEKILCSSRTSNTITVYNTGLTNGRGNDGTSVVAHTIGATVEHVFTATDADEANSHVNNVTTAHGLTIADVVTDAGTQTLTNKTLTTPILNTPDINGGTIDGATISTSTFSGGITATSVSITGSQTLADYRARNTYASTAAPTAGTGNDGDIWVQYEA